MFVLVHNKTGKYVARPGEQYSYVPGLENARAFRTRQDAERERCQDSERIASVESILDVLTGNR